MDRKIKFSEILTRVVKRAESFMSDYKKPSLSANIIFAAILEFCYVSSKFKRETMFSHISETENALKMLKDVRFDTIYSMIENLCTSQNENSDAENLQKIFMDAKELSFKNGSQCITLDAVLICILSNPTDEISAIMSATHKSNSNDAFDIFENIILNNKKDDKDIIDNFKNEDFSTADLFDDNLVDANFKNEDFSTTDLFDDNLVDENFKIDTASSNDLETENTTQKNYISNLTNKIKEIQKELHNVIFGQDNAINIFTSGYFQAELKALLDKNSKKPLATFLFAGPPGVGKTFLSEKSAELLQLPFMRFDMSEYSSAESIMELIGTNKSYKGDKEGALTSFVKENPKCILLFDEIEKANISVIHLFLQVLDAGRLRDNNSGQEVDFSQTVIIFTTNAGREIYENSITTNLSGISRKTILKALEDDVDPKSGKSVFPAAICSRFATGNVIMFNHMEAHVLRKIVEDEITRIVKCIESEMGIKCQIDDDVYSCLLFSEGGNVDARTIKSRSSSFVNNELYELFRLVSSQNSNTNIEAIENIKVTLELPSKEAERKLFIDEYKGSVLSFGDAEICNKLNDIVEAKGYKNVVCSSLEEAKNYVNRYNVEFVLCDFHIGKKVDNFKQLNVEDVDSDGRTFFKYICNNTDVALYVISDEMHKYSEEEKFSLIKEGARDILDLSDTESLEEKLTEILVKLHQQQSMIELAKSSKIVTYETAQSVSDDGKTAEIRLYDIKLATAVSAEDKNDILSDVSKPNIKLSDVYGANEIKNELEYFIDYLKDPKAFSSKGLGVPKGVLFYGPPGTGKTMLAKAVAGETNVTFISAEANNFIKQYYGQGEAAVRDLFAKARKYAPSIIFIDEIDAIAKERKGGDNDQCERVLNSLLAQMDGFSTDLKKPVFVLAATNFDVTPGTPKSLDSAFLRRFDRCVYIGLPSKDTRTEYLTNKIAEKAIFEISTDEINNVAERSAGMSLAQLSSVFEFAMRIAVMKKLDKVTDEIFEEAFETFTNGEEKHWDPSELRKTAFHEAGHAFICWYNGEIPSYLTIVSRGHAAGYMRHGDTEKVVCQTKSMLIDRIKCSLAGRAAEQVFFGEEEGITTGASADLKHATAIAKTMICKLGMDESFGLSVISDEELLDGEIAKKVRELTNNILLDAMNDVKETLKENHLAVEKIVEVLLEKNHLKSNEIDEIFSSCAKQKN